MVKTNAAAAAAGPNRELAAIAEKALYSRSFESGGGLCQRFLRQVVQKRYGSKYDRFHKPTAEESRKEWIKAGFSVPVSNGSEIGDILYKKGTPEQTAGHVGIRIPGNRVAENATTRIGRTQGFKGTRSLEDFGKVDTIVRLPK